MSDTMSAVRDDEGQSVETLEEVYDGQEEAVVDLLRPDRVGWIELPDGWLRKFSDATHERWKESPSSIVSYIGCPMSWLLERYLLEGEGEITEASRIGDVEHRVAEVFYNEPPVERSVKLLEQVQEQIFEELRGGVVATGIVPGKQMEEWNAYIRQQTERVSTKTGKVQKVAEPEEVCEKVFSEVRICTKNLLRMDGAPEDVDVVSNETWVRAQRNGIRINGKIDRIVRDEESGLEVVQDYKTGKTPFGDPEMNLLDPKFVPCLIYSYLRSIVGDTINSGGIVAAYELLYLRYNKVYSTEIGAEELDLADSLIDTVTKEMQYVRSSGNIKMCPQEDSDREPPCRFCPVQGLCPAFTEREDPFEEMVEAFPELGEL